MTGPKGTNIFDQFDAPPSTTDSASNIFDQFDGAQQALGQRGGSWQQDPIVAQSADGVRHQFPAGTDQGVIDRVMKNYATQRQATNWSDLPDNILPSAGNAIAGVANTFMHPLSTADTLARGVAGGIGRGLGAIGVPLNDSPDAQQTLATADAIGGGLKDRYWGLDNLKRTAVTDPVGSLVDIATLASGGEGLLARAGMEGSNAANVLGSVSRATNPVNAATTAISKVAPLLGKGATYPLGLLSGAEPKALQIAAQSGNAGGDAATLFRAATRGHDSGEGLVSDAKGALNAIAEQRRTNYLNGIAGTASSSATVDTSPIRQTLSDLRDSLYAKPLNAGGDNASNFAPLQKGSNADLKTLDTIDNLLSQWEAHPEGRTPLGMDALKQRLNELQPTFADSGAGNQRRLVTAAQDAIRNQITAVEPTYAKAMTDYATSKASSDAITQSLSLGPRASVDTAFSKLLSSTRGDKANRAANVAALEAYSPNLTARIAGQSLNDWTPKGGVAKVVAALLGGGGYFNPTQLALLPFTSPRFNAELAHAAGRGSRRVSGLLGTLDPAGENSLGGLLASQLLQGPGQ